MIEFNSVFSEHFNPAPFWSICYGAGKNMADDSKKKMPARTCQEILTGIFLQLRQNMLPQTTLTWLSVAFQHIDIRPHSRWDYFSGNSMNHGTYLQYQILLPNRVRP